MNPKYFKGFFFLWWKISVLMGLIQSNSASLNNGGLSIKKCESNFFFFFFCQPFAFSHSRIPFFFFQTLVHFHPAGEVLLSQGQWATFQSQHFHPQQPLGCFCLRTWIYGGGQLWCIHKVLLYGCCNTSKSVHFSLAFTIWCLTWDILVS